MGLEKLEAMVCRMEGVALAHRVDLASENVLLLGALSRIYMTYAHDAKDVVLAEVKALPTQLREDVCTRDYRKA